MPLIVEASFEVVNGLVGMKRDIILRLCRVLAIERKDNHVKMLIGVSQETEKWKTCSFFRNNRPESIPIVFLPLPTAKKNVFFDGLAVKSGVKHKGNYIVVDRKMMTGIYKIVMLNDGSTESSRTCGVVCEHLTQAFINSHVGDEVNPGEFWVFCEGFMDHSGQIDANLYSKTGRHTIALELCYGGGNKGVMSIFADGKQLPYKITCIPSCVFFWFGVFYELCVEVLSFHRLRTPTTDPSLVCKEYRYK